MSATLKLYDDLCSPPGTSNDVKQMFGEKTVDVSMVFLFIMLLLSVT